MVISDSEMLLRMGVSIALGAAIGYERERSGRPAGLRTHLLVSIAAATFMLVSTQFSYFQSYAHQDPIEVDPSRIAASVVSGVGFLGAGAILRTGFNIQGLTTAASLWLVSAVGLACGAGMYLIGIVSAVASLLGLILLRKVEGKHWRLLQRRISLTTENGGLLEEVFSELRKIKVSLSEEDMDLNRKNGSVSIQFDARFQDRKMLDDALAYLRKVDGISHIKINKVV
jgi:putative Mg2+ transporter-C (MgtC) family protein